LDHIWCEIGLREGREEAAHRLAGNVGDEGLVGAELHVETLHVFHSPAATGCFTNSSYVFDIMKNNMPTITMKSVQTQIGTFRM
jgi:hypothetical protein